MLRNEQSRAKASERAEKKAPFQHRKSLRAEGSQELTLALQAVRAGVPLVQLPPVQILALSARIGNSALLSLMAQQSSKISFAPVTLPQGEVRTEPLTVTISPLDTVVPPDWAALSVVQAQPADTAGWNTQGGVSFAGS